MNATHNIRKQAGAGRKMLLGACAAMILAAGAGTAMAQASGGGGLSGSFSQPLNNKKTRVASGQNNTTMMISESDGDDSYTLKIAGDEVAAEVNGKKVPKDRVRRSGDKVEILGKDGDVIHTFKVSGMNAGGGKVGLWTGTSPAAAGGDEPPAMDEVEIEHPPVMLGLLMNDSTDTDGIVVEDVFPNMPAAKGGLKKGDLIIKLDGKSVGSAMDLRDVIIKKKDGDKLGVVVKRDGDEKEITILLVAFDQEKMSKARAKATGEPPVEDWKFPGLSGTMRMEEDWSAQAKRAIEKALSELNNKEGFNTEQWKGEIQKALEQALAGVEKASGQMRLKVQEWSGTGQPGQGAPVWGGDHDGQGRVFIVPRGGGAGGGPGPNQRPAETNDKLDRLADQLERLNKRLADMEKKLAERKQP